MTVVEMLEEVQGYGPWYNPVDAEVVAETPCDQCGGEMHLRGFQSGDSRRAFAVCTPCDIAEEF